MQGNLTTMKRLAIIRYLYTQAVEQSREPEPMRALSLLAFHDSVELFLALAAETLNINCNNANFMEYWQRLAPKVQLTQTEAMRGLNKARNTLKHEGRLPNSLDIEGYRASTTNFFNENTPLVFGIDFSDISLTGLVTCANARVSLETAERLMKDGEFVESVAKTAIAFLQLINDYQSRAAQAFGQSPFEFHKPLRYEPKLHGLPYLPAPDLSVAPLAGLVEDLRVSVQQMQTAVTVLSLGLNYRRFARFEHLTPLVWQTPDTLEYMISPTNSGDKPTLEDCRFCIDFVIESALTVNELVFEVTA